MKQFLLALFLNAVTANSLSFPMMEAPKNEMKGSISMKDNGDFSNFAGRGRRNFGRG